MTHAAPATSAELDVALAAARAGGAIVAEGFRQDVDVRRKSAIELVSEIDERSERAIVDVIAEAYPSHEVLGEESHHGDTSAEHLWVVDPLDGTNNYLHGIPHAAVSIAYCHRGAPVCGVVLNPMRDECFTAVRGGGAWHDDRRVTVSDATSLEEVFVGVGFYYDRGAMMEATLEAIRALFHRQIHGIRRFGTASLDLCQVGNGCFGAFFEYELSPWDVAAGRLFVEEAGGRVTTCRGEPVPLTRSTILASNGHLHEAVRAVVEPLIPDGR